MRFQNLVQLPFQVEKTLDDEKDMDDSIKAFNDYWKRSCEQRSRKHSRYRKKVQGGVKV